MIVIEEMTEEDVEQASELESRSFSMPWRAEDFLEMVKADYAHYFVAKEEGKIIGCCGLRDISGEGEITNVVVDSDCRGRGIGRALMEYMLKEAEKLGIGVPWRYGSATSLRSACMKAWGFEEKG